MVWLITGVSGTIGRALTKELSDNGHIVFGYSRNPGRAMLPEIVTAYTGCVSDRVALAAAVKDCKPDLIVHLAANKHLGGCEKNPREAISTNLVGTSNVLEVALGLSVPLLSMSTDKAADPINTYSMTKSLGERLTHYHAQHFGMRARSMRIGNVLGSTGSVIPLWKAALAAGHLPILRDRSGESPVRFMVTPQQAAKWIRAQGEDLLANGLAENERAAVLISRATTMHALLTAFYASLSKPRDFYLEPLPEAEKLSERLVGINEPAVHAYPDTAYVLTEGAIENLPAYESATAPKYTSSDLKEMLLQL